MSSRKTVLAAAAGGFALGMILAAGGMVFRGYDGLKAQGPEWTLGLSAVPAPVPAAEEPRRIEIPRLGVSAPIVPVGLAPDGRMNSPRNETDVGWYERGPRPGTPGSAVLAGHLDTRISPRAVFHDLGNLEVGDAVRVVDEEGKVMEFRVVGKRLYPYSAAPPEVFSLNDGKVRLNLITCAGEWLPASGIYSHRLVVFTERTE